MNSIFELKSLLFLLLLLYINCCSPGFYLSSGKCIPCQPGYYSEGSTSSTKPSKCEECPKGTYSKKDSSKCISCPAGTFSKSKSAKCQNCPKGTFSKKGDSSCTPCPEKYFADTEGSAYCKKCPENTYSNMGSSSCLECSEGNISCPEPASKKFKSKRNNEESDILEKFGKLITSDIFGKSIEFVDYKATFEIPGFTIIVSIFSDLNIDLLGDLHFIINGSAFVDMVYKSYEVFENITETANKVIDALKGEYSISYNSLEIQLGEHIVNGEISINYDILLNSIEVTITSKLSDDNGNEFDGGVKYKIIPKPEDPPQQPEPVPVPVPIEDEEPNKEENNENNFVEVFLAELSKKTREYLSYVIELIKSPEFIAIVGSTAIVVLTVVLLASISGLSVPALITGGATALFSLLQTLLQNGVDILRLGFA